MNFDRYGGRRFLLCVGMTLLDAALLWAGKLSDGSYTAIAMATVAVYVAGNVAQRKLEAAAPPEGKP